MKFGLSYKIMSFRDLSKRLDIVLKSSRGNLQNIGTNFVPFFTKISTFIYVHKVAMKISCPYVLFGELIITYFDIKHDFFTILSLYDALIFIYKVNLHHIVFL